MFEFVNKVVGVKTAPFFLIDVLVIGGLIDFIVSYTDAETGKVLHRSMHALHRFHHHRFVYVTYDSMKNFTVFTAIAFTTRKNVASRAPLTDTSTGTVNAGQKNF